MNPDAEDALRYVHEVCTHAQYNETWAIPTWKKSWVKRMGV
jgi:hypothetical protein